MANCFLNSRLFYLLEVCSSPKVVSYVFINCDLKLSAIASSALVTVSGYTVPSIHQMFAHGQSMQIVGHINFCSGSMAFEAIIIMAKFKSTLWQVKKLELFSVVTSSPTLTVSCYIIIGHTHKQFSCTKPLPMGISVLIVMRAILHNCFCTITFYNWPNFLSGRIYSRYLFPMCWNLQICHAHWAFKLPQYP